MNITIQMRECKKKRFIMAMVRFYVEHLKLSNSRYDLHILLLDNCEDATGSADGMTGHDDTMIAIALRRGMSIPEMMVTIAHEMIHVNQIAKGQLFFNVYDGLELILWRGNYAGGITYEERPWEKIAYARQFNLVEALSSRLQFLMSSKQSIMN